MKRAWCAAALAAIGLLGCGSSGGAVMGDDDGGGTVDAAVGFDGATPDVSAPTPDGGGPGPAPTMTCPQNRDSSGFFTLTSARSDYVVHLPADYSVAFPTARPLLVALHGCGDSARNFAGWAGAPGSFRASHDYIMISIGGRENACWDQNADRPIVMAAIDHVKSCFWVHQKKIVLGGYSSGGVFAYDLGLKNAQLFAGILIENAGMFLSDSQLRAAAWKLNIAHSAGVQDTRFPIATARTDRDRLLGLGFPMSYQETPGNHDGTSDTWEQFLLPKIAGYSAP